MKPANATRKVSRQQIVMARSDKLGSPPKGQAIRTAGHEPSSRLRAGDQAGAALKGDIGPDPLDQDTDPVAKADQEKDVDDAPEQPGKKTAHPDPTEIGNRTAAPDGGEVSHIHVAERLHGFFAAGECRADGIGHVDALLLGGGRHTGYGLTFSAHDQGGIANDENLRMPRQGEIGVYLDTAGTILLRVQPSGCRGGGNAGSPDNAVGQKP